ncbi:MAG: TRAP transporter substrate-binding protein, partial [Albidovulum sp.]|nr:TRAP transporter substrate-binding protein [Albidovulum sp.]
MIQNYIEFAERVTERAGDRFEIVVHPAGTLFKGNEIIRAVRSGQAPIGARGLALHANDEPMWGMEQVPFLVTSIDEARAFYEATKAIMDETMAERGLTILYTALWPPQGMFTKGPVNAPEDLQGFRMRTFDATSSEIARLAGMTPTKLELTELPQALSTGIVEGTFGSGSAGISAKLWDYLGYYYTLNTAIPKSFVFVNTETWNALGKDLRAIILEEAAAAEERAWNAMQEQTDGHAKTLTENGMSVEEPSEALKAHFKKIGVTMTAEWVAENGERGQAMLDAY